MRRVIDAETYINKLGVAVKLGLPSNYVVDDNLVESCGLMAAKNPAT